MYVCTVDGKKYEMAELPLSGNKVAISCDCAFSQFLLLSRWGKTIIELVT